MVWARLQAVSSRHKRSGGRQGETLLRRSGLRGRGGVQCPSQVVPVSCECPYLYLYCVCGGIGLKLAHLLTQLVLYV